MVLLWAMAASVRAGLVDFSGGLLTFLEKRWGPEAPVRMNVWQRLVRDTKTTKAAGRPDSAGLKVVNDFFNQVP